MWRDFPRPATPRRKESVDLLPLKMRHSHLHRFEVTTNVRRKLAYHVSNHFTRERRMEFSNAQLESVSHLPFVGPHLLKLTSATGIGPDMVVLDLRFFHDRLTDF